MVVNAPEGGVVRAVLVRDGDTVEQGTAIIEISVKTTTAAQNRNGKPGAATQTARVDLSVAEAEATRTAEKVRRIEPLVARGIASRADLDAARASLQDAQARLDRAREISKAQAEKAQSEQAAATEKIVTVRAPVKGVIKDVAAKPGTAVTPGQPLMAVNKSS